MIAGSDAAAGVRFVGFGSDAAALGVRFVGLVLPGVGSSGVRFVDLVSAGGAGVRFVDLASGACATGVRFVDLASGGRGVRFFEPGSGSGAVRGGVAAAAFFFPDFPLELFVSGAAGSGDVSARGFFSTSRKVTEARPRCRTTPFHSAAGKVNCQA